MSNLLLYATACFISGVSTTTSSPFRISDRQYGVVQSKVLENTMTGESAEILSGWGGKIERLILKSTKRGNAPRDVIASRCGNNGEECNQTLIEGNRALGALLIPFANRIANGKYFFDGREYYLNHDNKTVSHGFLIAGLPMTVLDQVVSSNNATLTLGYIFNGTEPGYPFLIKLVVTYALGLHGAGLVVNIKATNIMKDTDAPFMAGCHPYFKLEHSNMSTAKVVLDQCTKWNRQLQNMGQVPNGKTIPFDFFNGDNTLTSPHLACPACGNSTLSWWDDGFTALAPSEECSTLTTKLIDGPDTLWLKLENGFRYVQIYTGSPQAGVAMEPMSSETNAFNNEEGLTVLEAGQTWEGQFRLGID